MAEYYSANLSQNVKRGFRENALKGKWNGGTIPLGYKVVDHRLTIDEETAPIVRFIFDMCAGGKTAKEIYNYLKEKQIRRANGKPIGYTTVLYMLGSRTYIGEYNHSGIVIEDGVPAIISKETFDKVQETIKKFSIAPAAHKEENDYLLTTHLYCGKCGALMTSYTGTGKSGKVYRYYICNRARKHECDKKKVDKDRIEDFIVAKTIEFLLKDDVVERLVDLLYELQYEENSVLPRLESQLTERTKEIDNIVTAIQKGVASDALMQRLTELEEAKRSVETEIKKEQAERPLFTKDQFRMALYNFRKIDTTTKEGKARLIETFIDRIYLYDDHMKIIYNINGKDEEISLDELESSKRPQCGQPLRANFNVFKLKFALFVCVKSVSISHFWGTVWGKFCHFCPVSGDLVGTISKCLDGISVPCDNSNEWAGNIAKNNRISADMAVRQVCLCRKIVKIYVIDNLKKAC